MNNGEIISLGTNIGILEDDMTDGSLQVLMVYYYIDKLKDMGLIEGGKYYTTDKAKRMGEFLIANEFTLDPNFMIGYMKSDADDFGVLGSIVPALVDTMVDIHTKGEDHVVNQLINFAANKSSEDIDDILAQYGVTTSSNSDEIN